MGGKVGKKAVDDNNDNKKSYMDLKLVFIFSMTSNDLLIAITWREFTAGLYRFSAAEQVLAVS